MKRKISVVKLIIVCLGIALVVGVLNFLFSVKGLRRLVFYYPDIHYTGFKKEVRWIPLSSKYESGDVVLVNEYLLGPIHYRLRRAATGRIAFRHGFEAKTMSGELLILDFDSGLSDDISKNYDRYEWWIRGLIKTLEKNTKAEQILLLEDGHSIRLRLGDFLLKYPIPLNS